MIPSKSSMMESPLHGNQGDRDSIPLADGPEEMTVAISREVGARGSTIARRVGRKLGWQVYTQELLEFLCANEAARSHVLADVPPQAAAWADQQLHRLQEEGTLNPEVPQGELPRLILTLAARGEVVLVGRGAGYLLPSASTLHVRIVAPLEERVSYMAQELRLTPEEARAQVRFREDRRAEYLLKHFSRKLIEVDEYDMVLNSYRLGEEVCAEMIALALQGKREHLYGPADESY